MRAMAPKSDAVRAGVPLNGSPRLFGLKPNHRGLDTGVLVRTNSYGFREDEYPLARRPGVKRVVVLGDSYTFGTGVAFKETYAKRLEAELNRGAERYEVINFGVPGYNTVLELATWREVARAFEPDFLIIGYVLNDTQRYGAGLPESGEQAGGSLANGAHLALKDASMLYRFVAPKVGALAGRFNARYAVGGTKQIIASFAEDSVGWIGSREALLEIVRDARARGVPALVVVFPMMVDFYPLALAHEAITRFCRQHGIDVLDLMPVVQENNVYELVVRLDGHPNGKAHGIFAERIYRWLVDNYPPLMKDATVRTRLTAAAGAQR